MNLSTEPQIIYVDRDAQDRQTTLHRVNLKHLPAGASDLVVLERYRGLYCAKHALMSGWPGGASVVGGMVARAMSP